ncbi:MAG: hypothetical protein ACRENM_05045 [Candidatus Dormibacteraceae bacterium]
MGLMLPTQLTQRAQVIIQNRVIGAILAGSGPMKAPLILRLIDAVPWLQRIPARLVGMGVRPEHVHTPAAGTTTTQPSLSAGVSTP